MLSVLRMSLVTLAYICTSSMVIAAEEGTFFGKEATGNWQIGLKGATVMNGEQNFDDASNTGVVLGYEFSRSLKVKGSAAVEFEGTASFDDGDIDTNAVTGTTGQWDVDTYGLFFAYRSPGMVYAKGRLGGLHTEVNSKINTVSSDKTTDTSLAFGAGIGVKVGDYGKVELEYTSNAGTTNDLEIISLGGIFEF